jgi:dipeptidase E
MKKLFLYSMHTPQTDFSQMDVLSGKKPRETTISVITNAADVIPNSDQWVPGMVKILEDKRYRIQLVDLNNFSNDSEKISNIFSKSDVIWVCGGHTFYLRWILKKSGADKAIIKQVNIGKVFSGWSAGAIIAGPTTKHFELMGDDPNDAPEIIYDGLNLIKQTIVPHFDNPEFKEGAIKVNQKLLDDGFKTIPLMDNQITIIKDDEVKLC